jgi:signal transduction histidine kinase
MQSELNNLKSSADFLKTLLDNITSAIFIVDKTSVVRNFNDSFSILFGAADIYRLNKKCGNAIGCYYAVNENKECGDTSFCGQCNLRQSLINALTDKVPAYRQTLVREFFINSEKHLKYLQYTTKYINYAGDKMVLVIIDDITEIETQKIKLEDLNEQKNTLIGMAAHDLRNPISIVNMYSSFIMEEINHNLNEQQLDFIKEINEASKFMLALISDILDLSKIEAGKLEIDFKEHDYQNFLEHCIKLNRVIAEKKNISIKFNYNTQNIIIKFDKNKIEQVLYNLIGNAIKYSYPGSNITVEIELEEKKGVILTKIIDEGQGIPACELGKIFIEFNKSSTRSTAGEKSTGLGLAISKKIIEGHGGKIGVTSEVKKGSTFYFELPV